MKLDHEIQGKKIHGYGHENLNIIEKMERKQNQIRVYSPDLQNMNKIKFGSTELDGERRFLVVFLLVTGSVRGSSAPGGARRNRRTASS
jgi:hypothetical protein